MDAVKKPSAGHGAQSEYCARLMSDIDTSAEIAFGAGGGAKADGDEDFAAGESAVVDGGGGGQVKGLAAIQYALSLYNTLRRSVIFLSGGSKLFNQCGRNYQMTDLRRALLIAKKCAPGNVVSRKENP
jgi:hypothetical protein